jgi:uncharacterized protein (TIGR02611 family)
MPATDHTTRRSWRRRLLRTGRRALVLVAGGALCLTGFVLLFIPGPGLPALFGGLTVLATEFAWAERLLHRLRARVRLLATRPSRRLRSARRVDAGITRYRPAVEPGPST